MQHHPKAEERASGWAVSRDKGSSERGRDWRDDGVLKSTGYSCKRPWFGSHMVVHNCLQLQGICHAFLASMGTEDMY